MSDGGLRLFLAADLPDDVRAALAEWGSDAARRDPALRAVAPSALHITLHFLGLRPAAEVASIAAALRDAGAATPAVALEIGPALWLSPGRPHVLTCAVADPDGALGAIHEALAHALPASLRDDRALRPHVTVARVRRGPQRPRRGAEGLPPHSRFSVPSLTLYRSRLEAAGARYESLERVVLPGT